ncbi:hypothetical protein ACG3SL_04135 [Sphingomonas sp. CJ20]
MNRTTLVRASAFAAVFLGIPLYWWAFPPRLPIGTANGVFTSVCCGSISLRDGVMIIGNGQEVSYVVEHDKVGRYVLPEGFVGASNHRLIFNRDGNPSLLRLEGEPRPNRIAVIDDATAETIPFERGNGS